jgi:ABC-type transport system involved in cytochrome bd biosynthesis fused ATPase/permease subunit
VNLKRLIKLVYGNSELTAKDAKDNYKANFQNNQSAQKNKNQRFLKTIVIFLFIITSFK